MGLVKHYLNDLICACSDEQFGQDAVEYAIQMGRVKVTGDQAPDTAAIMSNYEAVVSAYQDEVHRNEQALIESYGPIMAEIGVSTDDTRDRQLFAA